MPKSPIKKKAAKAPKKKASNKKVIARKASPKKTARKKSAAPKKKATTTRRKVATRVTKTPVAAKKALKKRSPVKTEKQQQSKVVKLVPKADLPQVEEGNPIVHPITENLSHMTEKDRQTGAVRNYDNHSIRLSNVKKGGPKPSGKKPLW